MINGCSTFKSDIWSLGITAIELAEGRLPLAELGSRFKILRAIRAGPPPALSTANKKWSSEFRDIVSQMLTYDEKNRPDAQSLLLHPFFKGKELKNTVMMPIVKEYLKLKKKEKKKQEKAKK